MTMRMATLILPAIVLLTACGGKDGAGGNGGDAGASAGGAQEQTDVNLTTDPHNSMVPVTLPSPTPLAELPRGYAGRWGLTVNDCGPARADAKGLLTIAGGRLTFHGSRATIADIRAASPGRITAALSFTGEGRTWRRATALSLLDDGRTLLREEQDPVVSYRYSRCP